MNKEKFKGSADMLVLLEAGFLTLLQLIRVVISRGDDFVENLIWFGILAGIWGIFLLGMFTVRYTFEEDHLALRTMVFKRKVPYEYIAEAELVEKNKKGHAVWNPRVYIYDRDHEVLARVLPQDREGFLSAIEIRIRK